MYSRTSRKPHALPAIFACCALAAALACGGCSQSFSDAAQALNDGVSADIAQLTSLDSDSAKTLFDSDYTTSLESAGVDPVDVYGPMFSSLTYEVSSISIADNTATVTVSISNKDLNQVFQSYTAAVTNELASSSSREALAAMDDNALNAHLAQVLISCLSDNSVPLVQHTVELTYVKSGSTWQLQDSQELVSALLGGLDVASASQPAADELVGTTDAASAEGAQDGGETADQEATADQDGQAATAEGDQDGQADAGDGASDQGEADYDGSDQAY